MLSVGLIAVRLYTGWHFTLARWRKIWTRSFRGVEGAAITAQQFNTVSLAVLIPLYTGRNTLWYLRHLLTMFLITDFGCAKNKTKLYSGLLMLAASADIQSFSLSKHNKLLCESCSGLKDVKNLSFQCKLSETWSTSVNQAHRESETQCSAERNRQTEQSVLHMCVCVCVCTWIFVYACWQYLIARMLFLCVCVCMCLACMKACLEVLLDHHA